MDFSAMSDAALNKYRRTYRIRQTAASRKELEAAVRQHFIESAVDEQETLASFIYAAQNIGCVYKLDLAAIAAGAQ
ncbi:hypothetical protein HK105_200753 [Polyrhizophydium stewartii]|uniref:Histone deacetylase complex subunit SAP30 Sin3 binding domain-containing protein n=1 Tax=Polyrhizophydium stewartii TaxID=2732419 RepID=A0ABR4NJW9_9FUNG